MWLPGLQLCCYCISSDKSVGAKDSNQTMGYSGHRNSMPMVAFDLLGVTFFSDFRFKWKHCQIKLLKSSEV